MTIRDRVRQWLGTDHASERQTSIIARLETLADAYESQGKVIKSSGEWSTQNGLVIAAQLGHIEQQLEHLTALIEPKTQILNCQPSRVLSFEAEQFENLANIITEEQANGVHR